MSENNLGQAIGDLAKTIAQNAENIADNFADRRIDIQLREGTITEKEALEKRIHNYSGKLINCFCTYCGNPLRLHEKVNSGFCNLCGENVVLDDALDCKFADGAMKRMSGNQLYTAGTYYENFPNIDVLKAAAAKNSNEAKFLLAKIYFIKSDYTNAKKYCEYVYSEPEDMKFCRVICKAYEHQIDDAEALKELNGLKKEKFRFEELRDRFDKEVEIIKNRIKENERRRSLEQSRSTSSSYSYNVGSSISNNPSGWSKFPATDFRTGEQLYRNGNGEVVNGSGEKVAASWWD